MNKFSVLYGLCSILLIGGSCESKEQQEKPNVLIIYCDDLGYGDIGVYNANSKIPTPYIDKLASEGLSFSDTHAPAAICGPSRYGILTGRYSWRKPDGLGNGKSYEDCRIEKERVTIAMMFQKMGYNTAQIGKWGLRHNYSDILKHPSILIDSITLDDLDFSKPLDAVNQRGFDYAFTITMLAGRREGKMHNNDKWYFENGFPYPREITPDPVNFDWSGCFPTITQKVIDYINTFAGKLERTEFRIDREKPFFIYFDPHVPHDPIVPNEEFLGKSNAGKYGDFIYEIDYRVGMILKALEENGLDNNTVVIFTSDNGAEAHSYTRIKEYRHYSNGNLRGAKRDAWEAGTRVPFIMKWPGKTPKGKWSNSPICLTDFFATFADHFNYKLDERTAEDSFSFLQIISKSGMKIERPAIIYHTPKGVMAIRDKEWVFIDAPTGMHTREPEWFREERGVIPHNMPVELFNLSVDPLQLNNIAEKNPEIVNELKTKLNIMLE